MAGKISRQELNQSLNTELDKTGLLTDLTTTTKGTIVAAVNENVTRRKELIVNVKDFGAKGDYNPSTGIGTDDTQAFKDAVAYFSNKASGGVVFVPSGTYKITDTITLTHGIHILGSHSAIRFNDAQNTRFNWGGTDRTKNFFYANAQRNVKFENIYFRSEGLDDAIKLDNCSDPIFENCVFTGNNDATNKTTGVHLYWTNWAEFKHVTFEYMYRGVYLDDQSNANHLQVNVEHCDIGIETHSQANATFIIGSWFEKVDNRGVLDRGNKTKIANCYFEFDSGYGTSIEITNEARHTGIYNCSFNTYPGRNGSYYGTNIIDNGLNTEIIDTEITDLGGISYNNSNNLLRNNLFMGANSDTSLPYNWVSFGVSFQRTAIQGVYGSYSLKVTPTSNLGDFSQELFVDHERLRAQRHKKLTFIMWSKVPSTNSACRVVFDYGTSTEEFIVNGYDEYSWYKFTSKVPGNYSRIKIKIYPDKNATFTSTNTIEINATGLYVGQMAYQMNPRYLDEHGGVLVNDLEVLDTNKGIILKSPDGSRYRVTIENTGSLVSTKL